jgi:hypothetical protein
VEKEKGMKKAVPGLSFMEKEQEKITIQPNIYRKKGQATSDRESETFVPSI